MLYKEYLFTPSTPTNIPEEVYLPLLSECLAKEGFDSFVENTDGTLSAFLPERAFSALPERGHYQLLFPEVHFAYQATLYPNNNWNERWERESFHPIRIGQELLIRAPYHTDESPLSRELIIEPVSAFGSGSHSTTRMMIQLLMQQPIAHCNLLDVGCGTGVLGLTALLLGAGEVTFVDIDSSATENTQHNLSLNPKCKKGKVHIHTGILDELNLPSQSYDIICANIHRNIIIEDAHWYQQLLRPNGLLFVSGFFVEEDAEMIANELKSSGFERKALVSEGEWAAQSFLYVAN